MQEFTVHYERARITTGKRTTFSFRVIARDQAEAEAKGRRRLCELGAKNDERSFDMLASYRLLYVSEG